MSNIINIKEVNGILNSKNMEDKNMMLLKSYDLSEGGFLRELVDAFSNWYKKRVDFSRILSDLIYSMADDAGVADVNIVIENILVEALPESYITDFSDYEKESDDSDFWDDFVANLDESDYSSIFGDLIADIRDMFIEHYKKETLRW